jgi:DNA-binding winged helix-turn-helix (wHTH) protein/tetratricopeptide (TPR) repeat protein
MIESPPSSPQVVRFGVFEVDLRTGELRKQGLKVKLHGQPVQILALLLERPGELVTREELKEKLWTGDTFVDFEHGLNAAVKKLRVALEDSADNPRFVETLPRRGYRFIAPVEKAGQAVSAPRARLRPVWIGALAVVAMSAVLVAAWFVFLRPAPALTESDYILLADWVNNTGDPIFEGTLKQGLAVKLEESPFLSIVSDQQVRQTLRLMERSPDEPITAEIGQEICQREGVKAMIQGEIAPLGEHYVISLNAVNCRTGESLAREQVEAAGKEEVLGALGQATSRLRRKLGESLASIEKFDTPLEQATTSSLEALQAYSRGEASTLRGELLESLRFYEQAIELDPNFAMAYRSAGMRYRNVREVAKARQYAKKAMNLLERVSEREKLDIRASYYMSEGDLPKAMEALELFEQAYPRLRRPHSNLGLVYESYGQYKKALQESLHAISLPNPGAMQYGNAARHYRLLNRLPEAEALLEQAIARGVGGEAIRGELYQVAFLEGDTAGMQLQVEAARGSSWEHSMVDLEAHAAAYLGKVRESRELHQRAIQLAQRPNLKPWAAARAASAALMEARFGNLQQARVGIEAALATTPEPPRPHDHPYHSTALSVALTLVGDFDRAEALAKKVAERWPSATWPHAIYIPRIRAVIEIERGNPARAVELLETALPFESIIAGANYTRGRAYLAMGKREQAAAEFQKVLGRRSQLVGSHFSYLYPLSQLGLARAHALAGDTAQSRKAYEAFFELWKDADPDIPILLEAKAEYAKLLLEAKAEYAKLQEPAASAPTN